MPGSGRRQQKKEATEQRLYEVAMRLFHERGYEATSVEAITSAAGVAKGTFFNYFPSKEAVLGYMGRAQMAHLEAQLQAQPGFAQLDVRAQLQAILATLAQGIEGQRDLARVVAVEAMRHRVAAAEHQHSAQQFELLLHSLLGQAQARGELRPDIPAQAMAALLHDIYFATVLRWLSDDQGALEPLLNTVLDMLLDGLIAL